LALEGNSVYITALYIPFEISMTTSEFYAISFNYKLGYAVKADESLRWA